eukprot:IDg12390t1
MNWTSEIRGMRKAKCRKTIECLARQILAESRKCTIGLMCFEDNSENAISESTALSWRLVYEYLKFLRCRLASYVFPTIFPFNDPNWVLATLFYLNTASTVNQGIIDP